jgi:ABC-type antimicrobial peptide transport system permease subunit
MSRKVALILATCFALLSLFLCAIGIYGVLAYLVTQRSREIGIRIALGGTTLDVFKLVLREGLWLVGSGIVLGLAGAAGLRQALQTQLYGLAAMDPTVIGAVTITLAAIAFVACSLPAKRAAQVNPAVVLNQQ